MNQRKERMMYKHAYYITNNAMLKYLVSVFLQSSLNILVIILEGSYAHHYTTNAT